jgi:hypothetical protein
MHLSRRRSTFPIVTPQSRPPGSLDALVQAPLHLLLDVPLRLQLPHLAREARAEVARVEGGDLGHTALAGQEVGVQRVGLGGGAMGGGGGGVGVGVGWAYSASGWGGGGGVFGWGIGWVELTGGGGVVVC